jgi:hypothetical protein
MTRLFRFGLPAFGNYHPFAAPLQPNFDVWLFERALNYLLVALLLLFIKPLHKRCVSNSNANSYIFVSTV